MNLTDLLYFCTQVASYTLQIRATDGGIPELSSYVLVSVEVADVNDNPPLFSQPNYTCVVQVIISCLISRK